MVVLVITAFLLFMLSMRTPVGFALAIAGFVGIWWMGGLDSALGILESSFYSSISYFEFITIPLFILMGNFLLISGVADDLFKAMTIWMGRLPGGLAMATAISGAGFGAVSGSSTAAAATLASTSLPAMTEAGYRSSFASGVVAVSGTLAMLIPPSVGIIFYGIISGTSISGLLIGAILPAALVTLSILVTIQLWILLKPDSAPKGVKYSFKEKLLSIRSIYPFVFLFLVVSGSIYMGYATPVEASALGALGALILVIASGKFTVSTMYKAVYETALVTGMLALIVMGAQVFGYFVSLSNISQELMTFILALDITPLVFMVVILCIFLILGCFLDLISILVLTVPVLLPIVNDMGIDPIWFGVLAIIVIEIGLITPPIGMNAFVVSKYTKTGIYDIFKGCAPFVLGQLVVVGLLLAFPMLVTLLPTMMRG